MMNQILQWWVERPGATGATGLSATAISTLSSLANQSADFWVHFDAWVLRATSVMGAIVAGLTIVVLGLSIHQKLKSDKKNAAPDDRD